MVISPFFWQKLIADWWPVWAVTGIRTRNRGKPWHNAPNSPGLGPPHTHTDLFLHLMQIIVITILRSSEQETSEYENRFSSKLWNVFFTLLCNEQDIVSRLELSFAVFTKRHFSHLFFFTCHIWENIMHLRYSSRFCSVFNYSHSKSLAPAPSNRVPECHKDGAFAATASLLDVLVALCSLCRHSVSFGLLITAGCSSTSLCRRHSVKKANKHVSSVNCPFRSTSATSLTCPSATNLNTFLTV